MEKEVRIVVKTQEFSNYWATLADKVRNKYDYAVLLMQTQKVVSEKFVKKLQNTELYEVRVSIGTNEYRTMLVAADNPNFVEATKVVLLNSFLKKDTKQYKREIEKANKILIEEGLI